MPKELDLPKDLDGKLIEVGSIIIRSSTTGFLTRWEVIEIKNSGSMVLPFELKLKKIPNKGYSYGKWIKHSQYSTYLEKSAKTIKIKEILDGTS